ncbi:uncharacterized protein LOC130013001 [Patella vulgata]|uniref:uncharacterized protein LOC130013001 n=1 Tax=Patella vulgata TaxID=6465 RepID=UPI0024A8524A|nr:uncharacterized protein LOC130013001 [Patella vulgata]
MSQVPSVLFRRTSLPLEGFAVRNISGSLVVYPDYQADSRISTFSRSPVRLLHRRLYSSQLRGTQSLCATEVRSSSISPTRLVSEQGEVRLNTYTEPPVHRGTIRHVSGNIVGTSGQMGQDTTSCSVYPRCSTVGSYMDQGFRPSNISPVCYGPRKASITTTADVHTVQNGVTGTSGFNSSTFGATAACTLVEGSRKCDDGGTVGRAGTPVLSARRRESSGMGCSFNGSPEKRFDPQSLRRRNVESRGEEPSHKRSRIYSSNSSSSKLVRPFNKFDSNDRNRQLHSSDIYQQARRNKVEGSDVPNISLLSDGRQSSNCSKSQTHSRSVECYSGCSIPTGQTECNRMDASPGSFSTGVQTPMDPIGGFIRDKSQSSVANLCITRSRSKGIRSRCTSDQLALDGRVCIPTSNLDSKGATESAALQMQNSFDRALVANTSMVPGSRSVGRSKSYKTTSLEKTSSKPSHKASSSKPGVVPTSRLDFVREGLMEKGFSEKSSVAVLKAHRSSTRDAYDVRWKTFVDWCNVNKVIPDRAPEERVADFIIFLRESKKLRGGTIASYVTSIASVRDKIMSVKLGQSNVISAMVKGFRQEDQLQKFKPPPWDLGIVLSYLTKSPYEPLLEADMTHLTYKTAFLLAFATAARVSEIHALDVTQVKFIRAEKGAVQLGLMFDFVAKNQRPGQPDRTFLIRSLDNILGPDDNEDLSLCPVRALNIYLQSTSSFRRQRKRLFLPLKAKHGDVKKNTLAFWLRATILAAYSSAGLPPPVSDRPHEIRAYAATLALHNNISVSDIMKGCFWSGDTTFANFYLRDLSDETLDGVHSLGPLVAAQQVLSGPRRVR